MSLLSSVAKDREFLSKIIMTCCSRGFAAFGSVSLTLVLGRVMGAAGVGLFMLAFSVLTGLGVVARFGMDTAILRFAGIAHGENNGAAFSSLLKQAYGLATVLSVLLAGGLYLGRGWLAVQVFAKPELAGILAVMAIVLPFFTHIFLLTSFFKALGRPVLAPFFESGSIAFVTAAIVLLAYFINGLNSPIVAAWSLFLAAAGCFAVGQFVLFKAQRAAFVGKVLKDGTRSRFYPALPNYAVMSLVLFAGQWGALLILGAFVPADQVGLFSVAHRAAFVVNFILSVFNSIVAPKFAFLHQEGQGDELERLAVKSTLYMTLFAAPVLLGFIFFSKLLLNLFGPEFSAASPYLICLALAQFVNVATGSVGLLLTMTGAERLMRNIVIIVGLTGLVLNFALCPLFGVWGATIATASVLVMQNLLAAWWVRKTLGVVTIPGIKFLSRRHF